MIGFTADHFGSFSKQLNCRGTPDGGVLASPGIFADSHAGILLLLALKGN